VNEESLGKDGNDSAHIAREEMMKDKALMEEFLACDVNSGLAKEMRAAIFQKIIWKVLPSVLSLNLSIVSIGQSILEGLRRHHKIPRSWRPKRKFKERRG
jgi:hypothetical protein